MKHLKKIVSTLLSACVLLSMQNFAFADETVQLLNDEIQTVQDDYSIYMDFPIQIDKNIKNDMIMDMSFYYLKNLKTNDYAKVIVTDVEKDTVFLEKELNSEHKKAVLEDVPNDTVFRVKIVECIDGNLNEYTKYIKTVFSETKFPVTLNLNGIIYEDSFGGTHTNVLIKKVGDKTVCIHDENEECSDECGIGRVVSEIEENELNDFYNVLDPNSYYEIQTEATINGAKKHYRGFVSTYPECEYMGVFTPGYVFYNSYEETEKEDNNIETQALPDFSTAYQYTTYRNVYVDLKAGEKYIFKFVAPLTGDYTIETVGNADTKFYIYSETKGVVDENYITVLDGGTGENAEIKYSLLVNDEYKPVKYIALMLEKGSEASCAFRIIRTGDSAYGDTVTNLRDEVQNECDNGNYSSELNEDGMIDYNGDVDVYGYDVKSGNGGIKFYSDTTLEAEIYTVTTAGTPFDTCWHDTTIESSEDKDLTKSMTFSKGRYYVEIRKKDIPEFKDSDYYDDEKTYAYKFNFYHPGYKDSLEDETDLTYGNNTPVYPTKIPKGETSKSWSGLTLHKGDTDWFSFETGDNGGNVCIEVLMNDSDDVVYTPHLFENVEIINDNPPEWYNPKDLADSVVSDMNEIKKNTLNYEGLKPNHTYFFEITYPDSSYSSMRQYSLDFTLTEPDVPSAILSSDVTLYHTVGENISSVYDMVENVMSSLNCYINGIAVSKVEAVTDVELYYNGEILTAEIVNSMSAGTYTIDVKYLDVEATGGTVKLVVNEAPVEDEIIMLENLPTERASRPAWDWAAAAKIIADNRLIREGKEKSTYTISQAIKAVKTSDYTTRGTIEETVNAANYFYSGGLLDTEDFLNDTIEVSTAERSLKNELEMGHAVIMQLVSSSAPEDVTKMRYIVLYGINLTTHEYIVFDPFANDTYTVSQDIIHNGGYDGNDDLRFTGIIIEF